MSLQLYAETSDEEPQHPHATSSGYSDSPIPLEDILYRSDDVACVEDTWRQTSG